MKNLRLFFFPLFIVALISIQSNIFACPKCNQEFYKELLTGRANTLGGQELLEAIKNQSVPGQEAPFILPSAYNSETDIKNNDIGDATTRIDISEQNDSPNMYTYIFIVLGLIFI